MDWVVEPIIEIVKLVGGSVVRYLKYQIKYNDYLKRFKESKDGLCNKKAEIQSMLETQLQSAPYHVARSEVEDWLKDAEEFIRTQDVEEEVSRRRYLSCCCRAVILEERTQELKAIHDRGDRDTTGCLVIEDPHRKLDYYVQNFRELKEKLQRKLGDIGSTLGSQLVLGKIEREEVKHWQEKVKEIIGPIAQAIEDEVDKGDYLSHPSFDPLATLLREKIEEMERKCEEGSQLPDCLVIDDPSAWAVELPVPELQGSEAVKAEILACLKGEEVTKLGVWGMGGVGKTTIMQHVHNELLNEGKFKKIIWVTVSQNFDIYNLQNQIASSLKEQLPKDQNEVVRAAMLSKMLEIQKPYLLILDDVWHSFKLEAVGIPEPLVIDGCKLALTMRSEGVARLMGGKRIRVNTLSQEEALGLFLDKVGDTVLSDHGGGIKKGLELTLKEIVDECDGLPLAIVTVAGSLKEASEPWLWSAALEQLRGCKKNVAGPDDYDAFRTLKFSYDHLKDPKIQYCFLYCALYPEDYNIPKEEIIEYWIDEGFIEEMETRHAMKDDGRYILRKLEDNSLLEFIKAEDEDEKDCVRMHDLIRDMALDITRRSPRFLVEAGKALRELPEKVKCTEDVEKVSLMCNYIDEIPSSMASSTCRRLTTLLLVHNQLSTIPEFVFEHMHELKILDLSFNERLRSLPNSASKLVHLATLLLERTSIEEVPFLSGLGSLKKLNLRGTAIKEVPEGLRMLTNLKCLALCGSVDRYPSKILEIDEIADGVLSNLSKLQELIVDWSKIKLKGEVVGSLMKLEVLHGLFPTVNEMRIFLKCQLNRRLSSYFITVGSNLELVKVRMLGLLVPVIDRIIDAAIRRLPRCKKIMVFNETSGIVGENVLFPSVQILCIKACQDVRSLNDFSAIKDETVTDLRGCWICYCDSMEWLLSSWTNPIVQTLEYLDLRGLKKLDGLFEAQVIAPNSPRPPTPFSSVKTVSIEECHKIKKLFPSWKLVEYLQSLEKISVCNCKEMEEIIASDPEEEGEGGDIMKKLTLPKLKQLILSRLPALKSICSWRAVCDCEEMEEIIASDPEEGEGGDIIKKLILPKLKQLILSSLPALKSICGAKRAVMAGDSLEEIYISNWGIRGIFVYYPSPPYLFVSDLDKLDGLFEAQVIAPNSPPPPTAFSSLKTVLIFGCDKIKKLFPSWKLVEYLQSLESIKVNLCEEMEEIIASDPEEGRGGGDIIKKLILPKLKRLELWNLPALKSICSWKRAVMACDSLEWVDISKCEGLRGIFVYHPSPPYLFVSDLYKLDGLFEAQVIAPNSPPPPTAFSSLKRVSIDKCHKIKKLFPSWKLVEYLQSLEHIRIKDCDEMEEIIASDPEEEGGEGGGDIIKKLILPKLKELHLWKLPALKSICSWKRAVMVCDSLEEIEIRDCKGLKRIPIYLPLLHNAQPSPPPSLKKIHLDPVSEQWWESLEWDHPNAKDVLRPMVQFDDD